jgi:outer membrane protein TolC
MMLGGALHAQSTSGEGIGLLDAARATLGLQPRVKLQAQQLEISKGDLQAARGQFDLKLLTDANWIKTKVPNSDSAIQFQHLPPSTDTDVTTVNTSLQKQFRTGLTLIPGAELTRTKINLTPDVSNTSTGTLLAVQPLLKGRGRDVVGAPEHASEIEVGATTLDLTQTSAAAVLNTVTAYWNYLAAVKRYDIAKASEDRSVRILDETKTLIDLGNKPAADAKQAQANVADRISSRVAAEQSVYQGRQTLGLAMGLASASEIMALPLPKDDFPAVAQDASVPLEQALQEEAERSRADLQASKQREQESQVFAVAARNALKPQLDLVASAGYSGLEVTKSLSGIPGALGSDIKGPNAQISLSFSFPFANNSAEGRLVRSEQSYQQAVVRTADLLRTIRSNVTVARMDVERSLERLRASVQAADLYGSAVDDEAAKQQLGTSTVIDMINTEDRLTRTQQDVVAAQVSYMTALARLRYETGTLVKTPSATDLAWEAITTAPPVESPQK